MNTSVKPVFVFSISFSLLISISFFLLISLSINTCQARELPDCIAEVVSEEPVMINCYLRPSRPSPSPPKPPIPVTLSMAIISELRGASS
ncbi:hypothetical protein CKAN_02720200 [Cinnamomum micranthum f. kanehirae]|uniref:Uncharacterized protein n=1 Tax=Cinnamomum micranthum f. kanehirae TaxID=337451 RepID=A0A3S3PBP0_9MAGN|nr:hypothetical protein CKAN_02720200 [Cinnamomum micranthum f. kanehirae]